MTERNWSTLVRDGKRAAKQEADAKWALGDLALEVLPIGNEGRKTGALHRLQQYADAIGVPYNTLRTYRQVSGAWAPEDRVDAAWSVHRELATAARAKNGRSRGRLSKQVRAKIKPGMTIAQARKVAGHKPDVRVSARPGASVEVKREQLRTLLDDAAVFADERSQQMILKTAAKIARARQVEKDTVDAMTKVAAAA